jgi:hypothetical protein
LPTSDLFAAVDHYKKFLRDHLYLAETGFCWTVVQPTSGELSVPEVASRFAPQVEWVEVPSHETIEEGVIQAGRAGGSVFLFERNGFEGSRPEVLRRLSEGARAAGVFWNVNFDNSVDYAVNGRLLTSLDAMFPDNRHGEQPEALDDWLFPLGDLLSVDWRASAMAIVEMATGSRLETDFFDTTAGFRVVKAHPQSGLP